MTETDRQELTGRFYAYELLLNILLKNYIDRQLADTGQDTEHLQAFVRDLALSFEGQTAKMTPATQKEAQDTVFRLLGASLQKYWT